MTDPTLADYLTARTTEEELAWRVGPRPQTMLRHLAARRLILEHHEHAGRERDPCMTLRILAVPYTGRDDFDPEWRLS